MVFPLIKRVFRFRLRSMLVAVAVIAVVVGFLVRPLIERIDQQQTQSAIEAIQAKAEIIVHRQGHVLEVDFHGGIVDDDLRHLRHLDHVREVNLAYCSGISDSGVQHLVSAPSLNRLYLYRNDPKFSGARYGLSSQPNISDESLRHLAKLPHLSELYLWDNEFSDLGLQYLKQAKALRCLELRSSKVSRSKLEELSKALPKCAITAEIVFNEAGEVEVDYQHLGPENRLGIVRQTLIGKPAVVTGKLSTGTNFELNSHRGKPLLLVFWSVARRGGMVNFQLDDVVECYHRYQKRGLQVLGANLDYVEYRYNADTCIATLPWPNLVGDEEIPQLNGAYFEPGVLVLIDRGGRIVHITNSIGQDFHDHVERIAQ